MGFEPLYHPAASTHDPEHTSHAELTKFWQPHNRIHIKVSEHLKSYNMSCKIWNIELY